MVTITQPLRDEHKELLPHIEELRAVADLVGDVPPATLHQRIEQVHQFLAHHLIPHAQAEDHALYPVVSRVMGAPEATATMRRDHVEIGKLTAELGFLGGQLTGDTLSAEQVKALRRVLYGLYALVSVHFAKEEEVYLPLLDSRLSQAEAVQLFAAMEHAAHEVKAALAHPS